MMFRTSILAVTTIAALTLTSPVLLTSQAVAAPGVAGPPIIVIIPADPGDPGDPGNPKTGDDLPTPPDAVRIADAEKVCNAALGALVKIPVKMVVAFEGSVKIVPVCNSGLGKQTNIDAAQAMPLQRAIGDNPVLSGPLDDDGLKADDVVGVVLIEGNATLYVHRRA